MTEINSVTTLTREGDVAIVTLNSPPVNALSANVRDGLHEGFKQAIASDAKAIVLICDGRTFIAGADITEFGAPGKPSASLFDVQGMMESSSKPVVAAIHGTALGGGLEVALCAHYRVAVPSARLGLPEVALGLADRDPGLVAEAARAIYDLPLPDQLPALARREVDAATHSEATLWRVMGANHRVGGDEGAGRLAAM
ncbi:MAG: enoyl-CoA hydratase-related protein, partial [Phenylobacterium sp.]